MSLHPAVILARPQLGENIGAAARAMANFGLSDLRLAAPRDGWPNAAAIAMAAGALAEAGAEQGGAPDQGPAPVTARLYGSVAEASADRRLVLAATARPRELVKPVLDPDAAIARLRAAADQGVETAVLFGAEASGLTNDEISACDAILTYPVSPAFPSLNLAQAVGVFAFAWMASQAPHQPGRFTRAHQIEPPAAKAAFEGLAAHLEAELDAARFYHPAHKRPTIARNMKAALARAGLTDQEIRTFRGAIHALANGPRRRARSGEDEER